MKLLELAICERGGTSAGTTKNGIKVLTHKTKKTGGYSANTAGRKSGGPG